MVTMHWLLEYAAVLCGYVFLLFIWPSVVFRRHLAGKSKVYWFGFCVCVQMMLVNTVVLLFGLVHILNKWTILLFFYGVFLVVLLRPVKINLGTVETVRYLVMGVYGKKRLFLEIVSFLRDKLKKLWTKLWATVYPHFGEYALLAVLLIFGMIYFSYGAFQHYSYGASDMYVHHSWIYGLTEGKIFSAGVYPEGMHCFVYCLHTLFGIEVYSILLFLAGIHIVVLLLAVYFLLKEIFYWRYTPFFVLMMFLTIDLVDIDEIFSMSRLQWTISQEFGLYALFTCALFLIRYLKYARETFWHGKQSRFYWDGNLFLFMTSIAASIAIHFYVTIMAVLLCVSIALFAVWKVFSRKRFVPLVSAVLCGLFIAATPMAGALISGISFQGSIGWAVSVMQGEDTKEDRVQKEESTQTRETEAQVEEQSQAQKSQVNVFHSGLNWCKETITVIYRHGYQALYQTERARWIVVCTVLTVALWIVFHLLAVLLRKRFSWLDAGCFDGYPGIIFASFLFMLVYAAPSLGLPAIIEGLRLCSTEHTLLLAVVVMPVDMLFSLLALICKRHSWILQAASILCTAGIYLATVMFGVYHGYLFCGLTRYNAAVMVTESIMQTFPQYSYTIVSPTDEIYSVIEHGRHEELLTFVEKSDDAEYTLPTKYVFIYIEKKPLHYAHYHFFTGPSWLAGKKYPQFFPDGIVSQCPKIRSTEISESAAQQELVHKENPWHIYTQLNSRTVLESKAYEWCKRFSRLYPLELNTYYEDDNFVCYYFVQEPHALYNLAIE